jgi:hypothetical protein
MHGGHQKVYLPRRRENNLLDMRQSDLYSRSPVPRLAIPINSSHQDCQYLRNITQTTIFHHLQNCHPFCTPCYQKTVVTKQPIGPHLMQQKLMGAHCRCAPIAAHPNFLQLVLRGWKWHKKMKNETPKIARAICRDCNIHNADKLRRIRERRTKVESKRGLQENGEKWTKCAQCHQALGSGPRWWICGAATCGKECRAIEHQGWGRSEKEGSIVGEEAV